MRFSAPSIFLRMCLLGTLLLMGCAHNQSFDEMFSRNRPTLVKFGGAPIGSHIVSQSDEIIKVQTVVGGEEESADEPVPNQQTSPDNPEEPGHPLIFNYNFPSGALINVKTAYGAKGDGTTDDTVAIQQAITDNLVESGYPYRILYFPVGTYLVSKRLEWRDPNDDCLSSCWKPGLRLQGQHREDTIIKLKDNAVGYDNPDVPKAVIYTASGSFIQGPYSGGRNYPAIGDGNEAFGNYIENLTIDTGGGNPGAIGIDFLANNDGAIRNVDLRGDGYVGISLTRQWPGPALISHVFIDGFDYGIKAAYQQNSMILEHIILQSQRQAGISNSHNILAIRDLVSENSVPAVESDGDGLLVLVDADLKGGDAGTSAIIKKRTNHDFLGAMLVRNITATGYRSVIEDNGVVVPGQTVSEYLSGERFSLFPGSTTTLNLPIENVPAYHDNDFKNWANVEDYGARGDVDNWDDDTNAIQAAFNSGKSTVYFPNGRYFLGKTLHIPTSVRKIIGMEAILAVSGDAFRHTNEPVPVMRIEGGAGNPLFIERIRMMDLDQTVVSEGAIVIEHASPRTLVLRDMELFGDYKYSYQSTPGVGDLYIENVMAVRWRFDHEQFIWARQLNPEQVTEGDTDPLIVNRGATLWMLGLKIEGDDTVIETTGGGRTEVLGGLLFPGLPVAEETPAFINHESMVSLSYGTIGFYESHNFHTHVVDTQNGSTRKLIRDDLTVRNDVGSMVPLYSTVTTGPPSGGLP